jgi:hypothetical protein
MKWGRRGLWWLGLKHDSEHKVSNWVERNEAGYFHGTQAYKQQKRLNRRKGEVGLGNRCEVDHRQRPTLAYSDACIGFIILARLSSAGSIDTLYPHIFTVSSTT